MLFLALIQVNKIGILIVNWLENPATYESSLSKQIFISRPLRTPEMEEMTEVAKVLVQWYQSKIAICSPFNLFQSVTNVVMLNETSSKTGSKPLVLNLNLIL